MLRELKIENYAIIEHLDICFHPGLNIITGETGAGKSILLGALGLLSGARADAASIRDGASSCVVEASFDISGYGLEELFEQNDLDYNPQITIRRVVNSTGKSRAYIDELPVTLTTLKAVTDRLVDIHSQHQTLLLAGSNFQIRTVDAIARHSPLLEQYATRYRALTQTRAALAQALAAAEQQSRERQLIEYQLDQLVTLALRPGETAELEAEQKTLAHAQEIAMGLDGCATALSNEQSGVLVSLRAAINSISHIKAHYEAASELLERLESSFIELRDIESECGNRRDRIEISPSRLESVEGRLDTIYALAQRYTQGDAEALISLKTTLEDNLSHIDNATEHIEALRRTIDIENEQATALAAKITAGRTATAPLIEKQVLSTLAELGIAGAAFRVSITPAPTGLGPTGADSISILFSGNSGVAPQPIEQVASGGEMSRVMLSLKGLIAQSMQLPTIIFDEIDTGVSGSVADRMGEIIVRMSRPMQIINITHLPQVASKGEHHYHVTKSEGSGTTITKLTPEERLEQIARMLSGSDITAAARTQAAELLK